MFVRLARVVGMFAGQVPAGIGTGRRRCNRYDDRQVGGRLGYVDMLSGDITYRSMLFVGAVR